MTSTLKIYACASVKPQTHGEREARSEKIVCAHKSDITIRFALLRLNAAIYLTWAAKYLQFSKAKTHIWTSTVVSCYQVASLEVFRSRVPSKSCYTS